MRPEPFDKLRTAPVEGRFDKLSAHAAKSGQPLVDIGEWGATSLSLGQGSSDLPLPMS